MKHLSAAEVVAEICSQTAARRNKVKKCTASEGPPTQVMYADKLVDLERSKVELDNLRAAKKLAKAVQSANTKMEMVSFFFCFYNCWVIIILLFFIRQTEWILCILSFLMLLRKIFALG